MKKVVAIAIGALLFGAGLAGGWLLLGLYSGQQPAPAAFERLAVEDFVSRPFTKLGMEFRLRNTGTLVLQIVTVMMNGHLNQSITGLNEGWNGTTALNPNQTALLYVYYPCYAQTFNDSIPYLSGSPTQAEMSNMEQWISSFNCTFTFLTTTAHQYDFTVDRLGFDLYTSLAIWESGHTFNFMATEQVKVTNMQFIAGPPKTINVTVMNTGTTPVTITEMHINNAANLLTTQFTVQGNGNWTQSLTYDWSSGYQYEVEMKSSKGNQFTYTATAPA